MPNNRPDPTPPLARVLSKGISQDEVDRSIARVLTTVDGQIMLDYLMSTLIMGILPPHTSDAELRHREGQRSVVGILEVCAARGRKPPDEPIADADPHARARARTNRRTGSASGG